MAKLKGPLMSFGASGSIGKTLVYFPWKGVNAVRTYVVPANPQTDPQTKQRGLLRDGVTAWHDNDYTEADRIAWNRYAGILADIMSGFNAMVRLAIALYGTGSGWRRCSQVEVDTATTTGFDVDIMNSIKDYNFRASIGKSKTHMPTHVALNDEEDGTYTLSWGAGTANTNYFVQIECQIGAVWYKHSGIYAVRTLAA